MFDLDLLKTLVCVVDEGSFTRAGERVHRTQSTVSQQVRKLEESVGRTLLLRDRTGNHVTATEHGALLTQYARRLLALSQEARDALRRDVQLAPVRIGVPEDFDAKRMSAMLSGFLAMRPDARLDTVAGMSADLQSRLAAGKSISPCSNGSPAAGTRSRRGRKRSSGCADAMPARRTRNRRSPSPSRFFRTAASTGSGRSAVWTGRSAHGASPSAVRASPRFRPPSRPVWPSRCCRSRRCCPSTGFARACRPCRPRNSRSSARAMPSAARSAIWSISSGRRSGGRSCGHRKERSKKACFSIEICREAAAADFGYCPASLGWSTGAQVLRPVPATLSRVRPCAHSGH